MPDRIATLAEVCRALAAHDVQAAAERLEAGYPFRASSMRPRSHGPLVAMRVFLRDGFVDRYSGERLLFTPVLRAISLALPREFPFHPNWRTDLTHPAYWELAATVDHLVPVTKGGGSEIGNLVTTSMVRNSAKGNSTLEELGWTLHAPGDTALWDGMLGWFLRYTAAYEAPARSAYLARWRRAAIAATTRPGRR